MTGSIRNRIEDGATEQGHPVIHLSFSRDRKKDITKRTDVFTFMGYKPALRFQGKAVFDYKDRPMGCRFEVSPWFYSVVDVKNLFMF